MSHKIFETALTTATRMVGPERPGGGDRTMIQIDDRRTGAFVQLYPSALQGILVALHDDGLPRHTQGAESSPFVLVASCDLYGGRLEARQTVGGGLGHMFVFVLCVDRPNDETHEEILNENQARALIAMQRVSDGDRT